MRLRPLLAAVMLLAAVLTGCSDSFAPGAGGTPTVTPAPVLTRDPTEEEVRAASAPYLRAVNAEIVSINIEDHHVGVYVRGTPEWTVDQFVEHLPAAAEAAREMLRLWPAVADVDICGDGPWLPRKQYQEFASASRVQVFRDKLDRLPPVLATPADVIREGGVRRSLDYYLDPRITRESTLYRDAVRATSGNRSRRP